MDPSLVVAIRGDFYARQRCNQGAIDLADALIVAYQRLEQIHALAERAHVELADHHLAELRETLEEIKELSGESD